MLTFPVLTNLSEQQKTAKEIAAAEELLSETLSRLARLRRQQQLLRDRGVEVFRRGMERLEAEEEPDSPTPMSEEQSLAGRAQSLGAFGIVDRESLGLGDPLPDFALTAWPLSPAGPGPAGGTPPVLSGPDDPPRNK